MENADAGGDGKNNCFSTSSKEIHLRPYYGDLI